MKTSELTGAALDWAVAKCEEKNNDCEVHEGNLWYGRVTSGFIFYSPSTDWAQAGPIIEREGIGILVDAKRVDGEFVGWWFAKLNGARENGPTALIAAMRCYIASKLGDKVDIPKELT